MAFDQTTRNRLSRFVSDTRSLLVEEFTRQLQNDYWLDPNTGEVTDMVRLDHLVSDARRETARLLRDTMEHYLASADTGTPAKAKKVQSLNSKSLRDSAYPRSLAGPGIQDLFDSAPLQLTHNGNHRQ